MEHGGYCDFCGRSAGKFAKPDDEGSNRDICAACAKLAFELLTQQALPNKLMATLSALLRRLLDSDTKKLVQAGFLDKDLTITSAGEAAVMALLVEKFKADLVSEAELLISEQAEKAK